MVMPVSEMVFVVVTDSKRMIGRWGANHWFDRAIDFPTKKSGVSWRSLPFRGLPGQRSLGCTGMH